MNLYEIIIYIYTDKTEIMMYNSFFIGCVSQTEHPYLHHTQIVKGSWEAIFRVTDDFYSMKGGVWLYITSQFEVWDYTQWRMVCEFTSHNNEKCETILNEGWCVSLHHITMRSVRPYSMKGGVWVDIT